MNRAYIGGWIITCMDKSMERAWTGRLQEHRQELRQKYGQEHGHQHAQELGQKYGQGAQTYKDAQFKNMKVYRTPTYMIVCPRIWTMDNEGHELFLNKRMS